MKKFTLIIISLLFFACQSNYNMETVIKNASGKTYYMAAPYKDSQITITINGDRISGYAGVNNYFGTIEIIGKSIKISNIGRTKMAGPEKIMKIEEDYIKSLQASNKINLKDKELRIGNMKFIEK